MPPTPIEEWPLPEFVLRVDNLNHEGARIFFSSVHPYDALRHAVLMSFNTLYTPATVPRNVKAIQLVLRVMEQLAYTSGSDTHKEIHLSLDWIKRNSHRAKDEIMGVLTHEVVHCYQYSAQETCPGGLIEGIADFVRLHASLAPPHWKRTAPEHTQTWDAGYEKTAYFLDWINTCYGPGAIQTLNSMLRNQKYHRRIFRELTGRPLRKLWALYRGSFPVNRILGKRFRVYTPEPPADSESEDDGFDRPYPTSIQVVLSNTGKTSTGTERQLY